MYGQRRRMAAAAVGSLGVNLGIVLALVGSDDRVAVAEAAPRRIPMTVVEPPDLPPTTPTENVEALDTASLPQANLPSLDLPALAPGQDGLALPSPELGEFDWSSGLGVPDYGAKPAPPPAPVGESRGPVLIERPSLRRYYPARAARTGVTGLTVLDLQIDARGRVTAAKVIKSTPAGVFERAARRAAKRLRYRPAEKNGKSVAGASRVELEWKLDD